MKFCINTNGTRVAYQRSPEHSGNPAEKVCPLVLLHGFCEDHLVWSPVNDLLKPPDLLWIDMPGFGKSELPFKSDMHTYAEAILAVLDAENIPQCVLIGHSMGGYVGLEFASRWPERLVGLGLFHSHPFEDPEERKTARQRGLETLKAGKRDLYVTQLFLNLFAPWFLENDSTTVNELIQNGKKQSAEGISAALRAMLTRRDHQQTLASLKDCPVLFLLGELDLLVPPGIGLKAALLPEVTDLHIIPEVAHMAMYEYPKETAAILNSFWDFCVVQKS